MRRGVPLLLVAAHAGAAELDFSGDRGASWRRRAPGRRRWRSCRTHPPHTLLSIPILRVAPPPPKSISLRTQIAAAPVSHLAAHRPAKTSPATHHPNPSRRAAPLSSRAKTSPAKTSPTQIHARSRFKTTARRSRLLSSARTRSCRRRPPWSDDEDGCRVVSRFVSPKTCRYRLSAPTYTSSPSPSCAPSAGTSP